MNGKNEDGHLTQILTVLAVIITAYVFIHVMIGLHHMHLLGNPGWPWNPSDTQTDVPSSFSNDTPCPIASPKLKG